ncbi:hypothetical protein VTK73DRAFT_9325 [Phialemonium thermophilum]|uniref:Uncharacterized protein n=1 Tax=Phialemonium thermophilum TaxID=223376 RepID=A0ABR3W2W5_9PEZI
MAPAAVGTAQVIDQLNAFDLAEKTPLHKVTVSADELGEAIASAAATTETRLPSARHAHNTRSPFYPDIHVDLVDRFVDEYRPLRVAVVGGGLTGVTAGALLPAKVPGIQLTIYEKNRDFGGTWFENVYPGVRCDVPSHVYQSTFAPKHDWSDRFAYGAEIRDYWQSVARKHNVYQYAKFRHRVRDATWDDGDKVWRLRVQDLDKAEDGSADEGAGLTTETFDVLITAFGKFNAWRLPHYPGMAEYRGVLRHASDWDPTFDPRGKRIAVIGNGASGIQLMPNLQKVVARLDHYVRNPTWIAPNWAGEERATGAQPYPEELKRSLADPKTYLDFRKRAEDRHWRVFKNFLGESEANHELRDAIVEVMRKRLAKKPELFDKLVPDFPPSCRRLTPGPGYLEALTEDNVDYITTRIRRFTATGIETEDGVHREVDAVICATGANRRVVRHRSPRPLAARRSG